MRHQYYIQDEKGDPIPTDVVGFSQQFDIVKRRVALTKIGEAEVSTVFLGIDHNFFNEGPPVLWETVVFLKDKNVNEIRYASRAAALKGHEEVCEAIRQVRK